MTNQQQADFRGERSSLPVSKTPRKIWIDLDNSPHVPFFKPIAEQLERRGYSVIFTARDCFQVRELADLMKLNYRSIGRHYGKHTAAKFTGTAIRAMQLLPYIARQRPTLAVSHGSRSMFALASALGIPTITIMDYEHARWAWLRSNAWALLPEVIPADALKLSNDRILRYPGIKEDVYAPSFRPDEEIKSVLGVKDGDVVMTLRPPANEAHYHNPESEILLDAVFEIISHTPNLKVILVPRTHKQGADLQKQWPELFNSGNVMIPKLALNGLDLIWLSDVVVSGGGTMNREAAALGVPVYSIFRGKTGAVDQYLEDTGRLTLLRSADDVRAKLKLTRRSVKSPSVLEKGALATIVDHIIAIAERGAQRDARSAVFEDVGVA